MRLSESYGLAIVLPVIIGELGEAQHTRFRAKQWNEDYIH
jgi:hypothetical protein